MWFIIFYCLMFIIPSVFYTISITTNKTIYAFIGVVIMFLSLIPAIIHSEKPEVKYKEKIEAVEKANKELEKFYIDYPEFKGDFQE